MSLAIFLQHTPQVATLRFCLEVPLPCNVVFAMRKQILSFPANGARVMRRLMRSEFFITTY